MTRAYYNEHDPYAAAWLRNLIDAGHIAPGDVDERSIEDVFPSDLDGYTQCHFFAGIGVWSYALRRQGWPDDRPVWTGSCPCQPFSAAGQGAAFADERHLWPHWFHLISKQRPAVVFGEQVASSDGLGWLDLVRTDMEGADYAIGAVDLCAAGVGAPHIRQRLWFVAEDGMGNANDPRLEGQRRGHQAKGGRIRAVRSAATAGESCGMADADAEARQCGNGRSGVEGNAAPACGGNSVAFGGGSPIRMADTDLPKPEQFTGKWARPEETQGTGPHDQPNGRSELVKGEYVAGPTNGYWRDADWLFCRDGKWRPVEPGTFPLAHGAASRVGRLRAYGNAIVAEAAGAVIQAYMQSK